MIVPSPGHSFESLKAIQDEVNPVIAGIIPVDCSNQPCPYMTDAEDLGEKTTVFETDSFIIEQTKVDDEYF